MLRRYYDLGNLNNYTWLGLDEVCWVWIKQRLSEVRSGILLKLLSTCEVTLRPQKKNQMSNHVFPQQSKPSLYSLVGIVAACGRLWARIEVFLALTWVKIGLLNSFGNVLQHFCHFRMVYPNRMLGQQLLDAGIVQFAPGSQLDVQKSMGA